MSTNEDANPPPPPSPQAAASDGRRSLGGRVGRGAALVVLCGAMVAARVVWSARVEWRDAEARRAAGDLAQAIDHYGRAARLYAPGNPFSSRALAALETIASDAEARADRATALSAWREVRSSVLATRAVYTPNRAPLGRANQRLAALTAAEDETPGEDLAARTRWHAERLAQDDAPSVFWSLVTLAGLCGWVGAALGFIFRGLDAEDRLRRGPALAYGLAVAGGIGLFLLGLGRA